METLQPGAIDTRPFHTGAAYGLARRTGSPDRLRVADGIECRPAGRGFPGEPNPECRRTRISVVRGAASRAGIDATTVEEEDGPVGLREIDHARSQLGDQSDGLAAIDGTEQGLGVHRVEG